MIPAFHTSRPIASWPDYSERSLYEGLAFNSAVSAYRRFCKRYGVAVQEIIRSESRCSDVLMWLANDRGIIAVFRPGFLDTEPHERWAYRVRRVYPSIKGIRGNGC
jgi:hypothetical protein